ncbi:MAG: hypothetical protein GJ676_02715 [Rhodobacteraceae bacterium]|nr:hypothetical protein [Paracoccaceae bacterium]
MNISACLLRNGYDAFCAQRLRWFSCFAAFFLVLLAPWSAAWGHFLLNLNVRIFHVEHDDNHVSIYVRMPTPYLLAEKLGGSDDLGLPEPAPFTFNRMEANQLVHIIDQAQLAADPLGLGVLVERSMVFKVDGERLRGKPVSVTLSAVGREPGFATLDEARLALATSVTLDDEHYVGDTVLDVRVDFPVTAPVTSYTFASLLHPGLPGEQDTANLLIDYGGTEPQIFRSRGLLTNPIEVGASAAAGILTFVWEGIRHILEGLDHVLFVACLVIGAPALRDLLWRVTGFTVGHSVTLAFGFFGFVPSAAWFVPAVETGIAVSIIYAGVLALRREKTATGARHRVFVITVLIGLLHGLGFSFVLQEILKVDAPNIWQSLLAFNIGVEIGQLAIVLALWPMLRMLEGLNKSMGFSARAVIAASCCTIALWWTYERTGSIWNALTG